MKQFCIVVQDSKDNEHVFYGKTTDDVNFLESERTDIVMIDRSTSIHWSMIMNNAEGDLLEIRFFYMDSIGSRISFEVMDAKVIYNGKQYEVKSEDVKMDFISDFFSPKQGEEFFYLYWNTDGNTDAVSRPMNSNDPECKRLQEMGNCFYTREEAIAYGIKAHAAAMQVLNNR